MFLLQSRDLGFRFVYPAKKKDYCDVKRYMERNLALSYRLFSDMEKAEESSIMKSQRIN